MYKRQVIQSGFRICRASFRRTFIAGSGRKYQIQAACRTGKLLVLKGKIALMKQNKKYIYISFFKGGSEVFRAKFIMEAAKETGEAAYE